MSKVVLLAINAKYVHSSLAVWVLAEGVSQYSSQQHDVCVVEATINQANCDIADQVASHQPDVVGVSTYIWNAGKLPALLKLLRDRLPEAVFVLGGPEASHNAGYWLTQGADHVIKGEGERTLAEFLDNPPSLRHCGLDPQPPEPPHPAHNIEAYISALQGRIAYLEASRGCPFKCAFCLSAGSGVRFFPIETAKEHLDKLSQAGVKTIKLVDRTFNCDAGRAYELFEYVINLDTASRFHFEVAADLFDKRTTSLLSTAPPGRIQLEAGLQSFFEPALKASSRQTNLEKAEQNIRALLREGNIHIHIDLIAGLPYETLPDFINSFDRAYSLGAHTLQLGFLKLLHGSALRAQAKPLGIEYSEKPPYEIKRSPWLSTEDIQVLKQAENALQHTHNKCRFLSALEYALSVSAMRPFDLFNRLGAAAPNRGTDLPKYAAQLYRELENLPGVNTEQLHDHMVCDWLGMVKGKNMPVFLKNPDAKRASAIETAKKHLGHEVRRDEAAILRSGQTAYADSETRNPVTGLYKVMTRG